MLFLFSSILCLRPTQSLLQKEDGDTLCATATLTAGIDSPVFAPGQLCASRDRIDSAFEVDVLARPPRRAVARLRPIPGWLDSPDPRQTPTCGIKEIGEKAITGDSPPVPAPSTHGTGMRCVRCRVGGQVSALRAQGA